MMALVAYSDESDLEDENDPTENICAVKTSLKAPPIRTELHTEKDEQPCPTSDRVSKVNVTTSNTVLSTEILCNKPINTELNNSQIENHSLGDKSPVIEDDPDIKTSTLLSSIPASKTIGSSHPNSSALFDKCDELTDVPTTSTWTLTKNLSLNRREIAKPSNSTQSKKNKSKKIQFLIPALSEFAEEDDEDELELPMKKVVSASATGSCLLALLPEPKNLNAKQTKRSLVPHILTKRPLPLSLHSRKSSKHSEKSNKNKPTLKVSSERSDSDNEDDSDAVDFFSLSKPLSPETYVCLPEIDIAPVKETKVHNINDDIITSANFKSPSTDMVFTVENKAKDIVTPQYYDNDYYDSTELPTTSLSSEINEEALFRLGGRRKKNEIINLIDVNADDALLDKDVWMNRALTDPKPTQSFNRKKEGMPSQQQKRKHQITYLAHQAKERELELPNNWSAYRMNKKQTQARYGF